MHVARVGFTPLKGTAHARQAAVTLEPGGPSGDRVFCLVDRDRGRVLRTVENPELVTLEAHLDAPPDGAADEGVLAVDGVAARPVRTGERLVCDYWGRSVELDVVDAGPVAEVLAARLGREVAVCAVSRPGAVVYGAPVTLVTTSSMTELGRRTAPAVSQQSARFRSTLLLDTGGLSPHAEDAWVGRTFQVGEARLRVRGAVPRCAVVDLDPSRGRKEPDVLKALGRYRRRDGEIWFGVDAEVTRPGTVREGDPVGEV